MRCLVVWLFFALPRVWGVSEEYGPPGNQLPETQARLTSTYDCGYFLESQDDSKLSLGFFDPKFLRLTMKKHGRVSVMERRVRSLLTLLQILSSVIMDSCLGPSSSLMGSGLKEGARRRNGVGMPP